MNIKLARRPLLKLATALCLVATASFSLCAAAAQNWRFYIYLPSPTWNTAQGLAKMSESFEGETKGELKVRMHLGGTLQIHAANITGAVADGVVQMGDDAFYHGSMPFAGAIRLPMLIQTEKEFAQALEIIRPYLEAAYAKKGVILLGQYSYPAQVSWSTKKLVTSTDMQGQKVRVTTPEQGEFVKSFGGTPVTLGTPDISSGLDRGVIDTVFTSSAPGAWGWRESFKYNYRLTVGYFDSNLIVNKTAFEKLSPESQATVRKVIKESVVSLTDVMQRDDDTTTAKMKEIMTVTLASESDVKTATAKMEPYWNTWATANGPEAVEIVAKLRAAFKR